MPAVPILPFCLYKKNLYEKIHTSSLNIPLIQFLVFVYTGTAFFPGSMFRCHTAQAFLAPDF